MKLSVILLCGSVLTFGCATAKQLYGPDGRLSYSVTCSGIALNWGNCFEKAGRMCGARGYDVLAQTGDKGTIVTDSKSVVTTEPTVTRNLLISCKNP